MTICGLIISLGGFLMQSSHGFPDPMNKDIPEGRIYYPNGAIFRELSVKDGALDGPFREYSKDGKLVHEAVYRAGSLVSEALYYENGALKQESHYSNGKRDGVQILVTEDGQRVEEVFKDGVRLSTKRFDSRKSPR